jgi:hypothetical protein
MSIEAPEAFIGRYPNSKGANRITGVIHYPHFMSGDTLRDQMFQIPQEDRLQSSRQLLAGFNSLLGGEFYTPISPRSFTAIGAEINVKGIGNAKDATWFATGAPLTSGNKNEAGQHIRLQRETSNADGLKEITSLSVMITDTPHGDPTSSIQFDSYLLENHTEKESGRRIVHDLFHPGPNTYAARDAATQFMAEFMEIADLPQDKVEIINRCNTSKIVPRAKMREAVDKARTRMIDAVEGSTMVVGPNGNLISRAELVESALAGETEDTPEEQKARHMTYEEAARILAADAINGNHSFFPGEREKKKATAPIAVYSSDAESVLVNEFGTEFLTDRYLEYVSDTVNTSGTDNKEIPKPTINRSIELDENGKDKDIHIIIFDSTAVAGPFGYPVTEPTFIVEGNELVTNKQSLVIQSMVDKEITTYLVSEGTIFEANITHEATNNVHLTRVEDEIAYTIARRAQKAAEMHRKINSSPDVPDEIAA